MRQIAFIFTVLFALVVSSCSDNTQALQTLLRFSWKLEGAEEVHLPEGQNNSIDDEERFVITFIKDGYVSCTGVVKRMLYRYKVMGGGKLGLKSLMVASKGDKDAIEIEDKYFAMLKTVDRFKLQDTSHLILYSKGKVCARYSAYKDLEADPTLPFQGVYRGTLPDFDGSWVVTTLTIEPKNTYNLEFDISENNDANSPSRVMNSIERGYSKYKDSADPRAVISQIISQVNQIERGSYEINKDILTINMRAYFEYKFRLEGDKLYILNVYNPPEGIDVESTYILHRVKSE